MRELKRSTAANVMLWLASASDHISGATGLTLTITASKDGGAFTSITLTVTERGSGWYSLALTASHTDTLGDLALHVTATGADTADVLLRVIAIDKADAAGAGLSRLDTTVSTIPGLSATGLLDLTDGIETGFTPRQVLRGMASVLLGKSTDDGATYRDLGDTKDRVAATVNSSGERTAVTRDLT